MLLFATLIIIGISFIFSITVTIALGVSLLYGYLSEN